MGSITLSDLYKSAQDQLVLTIERSLDLGKEDIAVRLDDVLLRQRFWEEDIRLEDGALSNLEVNDALASSIIRRYLEDILHSLHGINDTLSGSLRYVSLTPSGYNQGSLLYSCRSSSSRNPLTMISETDDDEKKKLSLLSERNTKLCDQVEIFDAVAANGPADAAGNDRKITTMSQLRSQLEEENDLLLSGGGERSQAASVLSVAEESEARAADIHSKIPNDKREISPAPPSARLGTMIETKAFGQFDLTRTFGDSVLEDSGFVPGVQDRHKRVLYLYRFLIDLVFLVSGPESHIATAFSIELARVQQWGDRVLGEKRALVYWNLCALILTNQESILSNLGQLAEDQGRSAGLVSGSGRQRKHFESDLSLLSNENDNLVGLTSRGVQESLRRQLRIQFVTYDVAAFVKLESASALLGHSDLEQLAKTRLSSELNTRGVQLHAHRTEKLSTHSLSNDSSFWLDKAEIAWQSSSLTKSDTIASAKYGGESVIIQLFRQPSSSMERVPFIRNLSGVSEAVNHTIVPLGISSLHVLGHFEHSPDFMGCVYRLPSGASPSHMPITLREILNHTGEITIPELGKRFELSIALVKTIHEIHMMGVIHGDIQSSNILFWPTANDETEPDLSRPFLIGYNTRSVAIWNNSKLDLTSLFNGLSSDLEGLADVLSQIGYGGPPSSVKEMYIGNRYGHNKSGRLRGYVGARYENAVNVCKNREFDIFLGRPFSETQWQEYLHQFQTKVVDPIASCIA
ncbi:hypothetical protein IMSHALPRED_000777 [Imshaugia aleurites]|uniref:Protein kinase domain-containing protein n=1 Tax=Imshaugia aleurites TaxID=172621 RepID=A0A8H3GBB2_9LECA|nr:hypothetical protein IMSHALPRED_000777 [Imshaugia aleurites]